MSRSAGVPWSRHRVAIAGAFLAQGLVFLALTTRLPQVQAKFALSSLAVSALLLIVVVMAGVGSVLSELVATRRGSALGLRTGLLLMVVGLATIGSAQAVVQLCLGLAVYGLCLGMVDAGTNMQAVALEHRVAQPILPTFHSAWTLGGILGTLITLATPGLTFGAGVFVVLAIPVLASVLPFLGTDKEAAQPAIVALPVAASWPATLEADSVPWRRIVPVGLAIVLFYMVDTASTTWGSIYFDSTLHSPARLVALATLPYLLASFVGRFAGDALTRRLGPVLLLRVGAVVAMVALAVVVFAQSWPVGLIGFFVLGLGVAVIAPLSFSAAAAIARDGVDDPATVRARVDSVIARFNQFNYAGALLGAVMTGIFGAGTLRIGFAVPMVLIVGILPLATAFRPVTGARS